jgi:hypothetical protein
MWLSVGEDPTMSDEPTTGNGFPGDDTQGDDLLAELRMLAAATDPVPPAALAAARSAIAWRTMDAELAELTADTSAEPQLAGVRGAATPAMLTFEAAGLTVEVEVIDDGRTRRFLGQLVPTGPVEVEIRHGGGRATLTADEVGRFAASGIIPGPVSIRCRTASAVVETDWFLA